MSSNGRGMLMFILKPHGLPYVSPHVFTNLLLLLAFNSLLLPPLIIQRTPIIPSIR
jgi:hypothetical protein